MFVYNNFMLDILFLLELYIDFVKRLGFVQYFFTIVLIVTDFFVTS